VSAIRRSRPREKHREAATGALRPWTEGERQLATVTIPLLLKDVTGGARRAQVPGATLAEIVRALDRIHPGIEARIHSGGKMNPNLAFTVDGAIAAQGLSTPVGPDSEVSILPAFGGG
jgi:molybdopterin converting factor small subunit